MGKPLDIGRLHELCGRLLPEAGGNTRARDIVRGLGPLAALWLRPEVLDRAHAWHCEMTGGASSPRPGIGPAVARGQIGILLATEAPDSLPLLRPAFVLPVEWRSGGRSSPLLPAGLAAFGDKVLRDIGIPGLSLHLASWLERDGGDLSGLAFSPDSAWASLAAGAIVASQGGLTLPDVFVSAAWSRDDARRGWITRVEHVAAKLDAAAEAGAAIVLLPRENDAEAAAWQAQNPGKRLDVRHLSNATGDPQRALADVLHALEATPTRAAGATFEECAAYYVRMPEAGHNEYYRDELAAEVVARMRPQVDAAPRLRDVDRLVIIASRSWSLGVLLTLLFDPPHVLVLHDGGLNQAAHVLMGELPTVGRNGLSPRAVTEARCCPGDTFPEEVAAALNAFASDAVQGTVAIDLTAGYRDFHFAVLAALPPKAEAVFVHAPQDRRHWRVRPGTEQLRRLIVPGRSVNAPPGGSPPHCQ
jgi:hypothetical protein